jgi:hypothetical protein
MLSKLAKSYLGATIPVVNINGVIRPETYRGPYPAPTPS